MAQTWTPEQLDRLADQVRHKLRAKRDLIAKCDGQIIIKAIPKGSGVDVKITVTM